MEGLGSGKSLGAPQNSADRPWDKKNKQNKSCSVLNLHGIGFAFTVACDRQHCQADFRPISKTGRGGRAPPGCCATPSTEKQAPTQHTKVISLTAVTTKLKSYYRPDEKFKYPPGYFPHFTRRCCFFFFATRQDGPLCSPRRGTRTPRCSWSTFRKRPVQFGDVRTACCRA